MSLISSRYAIQKVLDEEAKKFQDQLKEMLKTCDSLSVTMDIWSDAAMRGYMGLTAHFLKNDKLCSKVLGVPRFEGEF